MRSSSPSLDEWKRLYDVALRFKQIKSWNWMYDSDLFGVQNPETGETGYCCVLGHLGEVFGLSVYLGTEGLRGLLDMQSGVIAPHNPETMHAQKCLMTLFTDRQDLQKPDREIIKKLGLKFRGSNEWPLFRSCEPGYHPWYLTRDEVRFLTLVTEQACEVCLRYKEDNDLLDPRGEGLYLVRIPVKQEGNIVWTDQWLKPAPVVKEKPGILHINELQLARTKTKAVRRDTVWELDFHYSPFSVQDSRGQRPYYPYMCICVDRPSELIVNVNLFKHNDYRQNILENMLHVFEETETLPVSLWVKREEVHKLFKPVAGKLGIKLKLVPNLRLLERITSEMVHSINASKLSTTPE